MRGSRAAARYPPPWWPEGEPWPPQRHPGARLRRGRRRFLWRAGLVAAPLLILAVIGAARLLGWILEKAGLVAAGPPAGWWPVFVVVRVLVAALVFVFVMRRLGRPLDDVVGAADRVAEGDFSVRVREHGPPWVRSLGRAFNSMTAGLERQQRQRRDLMADVAHELRTPLAVMQGRLEGMLDGIYPRDESQVAQILEETRQLSRLVEDLRTFAHSEGGTLTLRREPTDLAALLEDAAAAFRPDAERRRIALDVRIAGQLPLLDLDPVRIREVLTNLLSNALRYAPDGGVVVVDARAGAGVVVEVTDDGPGIAPEDLPHVFDRFYKGRASTGSGLGLAIAHNLIVAHGGTIAARNEEPRGTTMTITLPDGL